MYVLGHGAVIGPSFSVIFNAIISLKKQELAALM